LFFLFALFLSLFVFSDDFSLYLFFISFFSLGAWMLWYNKKITDRTGWDKEELYIPREC
jgi:hypothetical protein